LEQEKCKFENGSARKYNKYSDKICSSVKWLFQNHLLTELHRFYNHESINVKAWAARYSLEIDTTNALQILKELVLLNDSDSEYVLMEWRAGTLDMDFFKET
jgi:hypothetical protein